MPPIILLGLIISAIYLLFNDDEQSARKAQSGETNETVLAHDVSRRRRVRNTRLERKRVTNGVVTNRTRVRSTITDEPDDNDQLVNDVQTESTTTEEHQSK